MNAKDFEDYLKNRYNEQLKYYNDASAKNKKKYKNFQWVLIIFSTLTTILAALPDIPNFPLKYIVVATAAIVTILTAGLKTFQYQELWVNYRSTSEQLKPEIFYYKFNVGDYGQAGVDKESTFVSRVEKILNKEHDIWPVSKKLNDQPNQTQQQIDDLQSKLAKLLQEKFNTQKTSPPAETTDTNQPGETTNTTQTAETTDTNQPVEKTDTEQPVEPVEKTDDVAGENKDDETGNK